MFKFKKYKKYKYEKRHKIINLMLPIIFVVMGNIFIAQFKMGEKFIYYWDISGYWINTINYTELIFSDFFGAMNKLYESILHNDYTLLPVLFFVPVFRYISQSNTAFILTTYNLFGVPFMLLMYRFFIRQFEIKTYKDKVLVLTIIFTYTVLLTPIMGGFLDVCGLMFISLLLVLVQSWDFKINIYKCIYMSFIILVLCFLRRWYSFWAVSFFVSFFASYFFISFIKIKVKIIKSRQAKQINNKIICDKIINMFINLFICGILWIAVLFIFFRQFLINVMTNNFSFRYSAYDFGGLSYNLNFIISQFGVLFVIFPVSGILLCFLKKNHVDFAVYLLLQFVIILVMFTKIQSLGIQHLYLFVPAMLYFTVYSLINIPLYMPLFFEQKIKQKKQIILYVIIFLTVCMNFFNTYYKHENIFIKTLDPLFSQKKLYRRERGDIEEIRNMVSFINELSENRFYTYVLSSSGILNSDILRNAYLPYEKNAVNRLFYTFDVDKRDGFPNSFYAADIIVVAEPIQFHLNPQEQQIVGILADAILSGKADSALELVRKYELDDNVTVKIFKKTGAYSHEFINFIDDSFKQAYPNEQYSFINNTISMYSHIFDMNLQKGKNIIVQGKNQMGLELGIDNAGFKINLEGKAKTINFDITANYAGETTGKFLVILDDKNRIIKEYEIICGNTAVEIDVASLKYVEFLFSSDFNKGNDKNNGNNGIENIYITISNFEILN